MSNNEQGSENPLYVCGNYVQLIWVPSDSVGEEQHKVFYQEPEIERKRLQERYLAILKIVFRGLADKYF